MKTYIVKGMLEYGYETQKCFKRKFTSLKEATEFAEHIDRHYEHVTYFESYIYRGYEQIYSFKASK